MERTLKEAKQSLRINFIKGSHCECCGQFVKLYKRKLNSGMAITLYQIWKYNKFSYVNVKSFLREQGFQNNHDWTLLRHWGFLEEKIEKDDIRKSSGVWRITPMGLKFIMNELETKKHVLLFDNKFQGWSDETTTMEQSLGNKFKYPELMSEEIKKECLENLQLVSI